MSIGTEFGGGPAIRRKTYGIFHKHNTQVVLDEIIRWSTEAVFQLGCSPSTLAIGIGRLHFEAASLVLQAQVNGRYDIQSVMETEITQRMNNANTNLIIRGELKMKKIIMVVLLATLIMASSIGNSFAAETFTFRNIPWLTSKADVITAMTADGYKISYQYDNTTIPDWFQIRSNVIGDVKVKEGGCYLSFNGVKVAGYSAYLETYYWYPIVDGSIQKDDDSAQFYLAQYEIFDIDNMDYVYDDLLEKLTSLYGKSEAKNSDDSATDTIGVLWTADDSSLIWLAKYNSDGETIVKIWYAAPHCTETLQALEEHIAQETLEAEENERENNKTNTEGL